MTSTPTNDEVTAKALAFLEDLADAQVETLARIQANMAKIDAISRDIRELNALIKKHLPQGSAE